jgi:hypothetical protein
MSLKSAANRATVIASCLGLMLIVPAHPGAANAQGLMQRAKDAAKRTAAGKVARKIGAEAQMIDAITIDLEPRNLATVSVGALKLGASSVEIKNGDAVRIKLYLFNPTQQSVTVPLPPGDLFVALDEKGRKLEIVGDPQVKDLVAGSTDITVPAMERAIIYVLFEDVAADAKLGNLKIGPTGIISGIPLNTSAASSTSGTTPSPWKQ